MKRSLNFWLWPAVCLGLAALLAAPALASGNDERSNLVHPENVIYSGIDLWVTPADGMTFSDFSHQPIPAGFFCAGSAPFTGKVAFRGGGLETVPTGILNGADTVIHRMDDAVFDADGQAVTRVKFLALSLTGIDPVETECGSFQASIRLSGAQPETTMRIQRKGADSGTYSATLAVNAKVTFTPLAGQASARLELAQSVRFAPNYSVWARQPGINGPAVKEYARVDVDGDHEAETVIPGPSNFKPGFVLQEGALAPATFQESISPSPCPVAYESSESVSASSSSLTTRPQCHCDPTVEWTSNPDCADWDTSQCVHLHCPNGPDPRIASENELSNN